MLLRFFVLLYMITLTLDGDEISSLISKIQHADTTQKRVLINELKLKLRGEKASKRADVIAKLRGGSRFHHQHSIHNTTIKVQRGKTTASTPHQYGHR